MDPLAVVAVTLLVFGIVGTLIPLVPGGLLSLLGVYLYWWQSAFTEPGPLALAVLTLLGILTLIAEFLGGAVAARVGGAAWETTALAAIVGIALMILTGPLGLLVGLFGTVFVLEFARNESTGSSMRSAVYATMGILASTAIQVLLTTAILLGFVVAVVLF